MTSIVMSRAELEAHRAALLTRTGLTWAELQHLANQWELRPHERNAYETIRSIDWLLGLSDSRQHLNQSAHPDQR